MNESVSPPSNIRAADRTLVLQPIEGQKPLATSGLPDPRLFSGEQGIKVKMDPQTCLWHFQYTNKGILPEALKGAFTSFGSAYRHAENYFQRRNVKITAVKD